jgi:hypothetical protein
MYGFVGIGAVGVLQPWAGRRVPFPLN